MHIGSSTPSSHRASFLNSGLLISLFAVTLSVTGCDPNEANPADSTESADEPSKETGASEDEPGSAKGSEDPSQEDNASPSENNDGDDPDVGKSPDEKTEDGDDDEQDGSQSSPGNSGDDDSAGEPSPEPSPDDNEEPDQTEKDESPDESTEGDEETGEGETGDDDTQGDDSGGDEPGDEPGDDEPEQIDCSKLVASGVNKGDVLPDLAGVDETGQKFSLHSLCNKAVLFEVSTGWCGPCNQVAPHLQSLYEKYKDQGFEVVTVLAEGFRNGAATTQADLKRWKTKHGLTHRVVAPSSVTARAILKKYWNDSRGFPSSKLMAPGMVVHGAQAHSEKDNQIESALPKP